MIERLAQMQAYLMAEEIEVDPCIGRASLGATQQASVEGACTVQITDIEGKVKYACLLYTSDAADE